MELKLYNTLTRTKEPFRPLDPANVRMYVCGPTVYDFAHIGNARPVIVFDVLYRLLRHLYGAGHVKYVRNITDVDDKINARAAERGISIRDLTDETYEWFREDVKALGCLPPTHEPRATEHIGQMKEMIEQLVASEHAYVQDDHALFHVPSMLEYGELSRRSPDEMIVGARVEVAPYKRDPRDFVLWKPSDNRRVNYELPSWRSPCEIEIEGRPGWHIECSAMSWEYLGEVFDIHGGGIDLVFPHHENEIAQSRCAFHTSLMAQVWMHNGFVQLEGTKMSKSEGNFIVIRQLLQRVAGSALRLTMLKTHYREPLNWTELSLQESRRELSVWSDFVAALPRQSNEEMTVDEGVIAALHDDLNTPEAITRLRFLFKRSQEDPEAYLGRFVASAKFLGFSDISKSGHFRIGTAYYAPKGREDQALKAHQLGIFARAAKTNNLPDLEEILGQISATGAKYAFTPDGDIQISFDDISLDDVVTKKIDERKQAKERKDFAGADRIRNELKAMGVVLKDNKDGTTTWELAR